MTEPSLLEAAVDEIYSHPMAEFTARRKALSTAARKAGDRDAAAKIAGLRKPTLSADTLNRLVRSAPDDVGELLDLGADLRAAEKALDGAALRELSNKRRQLVNDLARLAFELTEQSSPSAAVREEVTGTLNAALADEDVADLLMSGALVTQARWDGFGSTSLPELAAVLPMDPERHRRKASRTPPASTADQTSDGGGPPAPDDRSAATSRSAATKRSAAKTSSATDQRSAAAERDRAAAKRKAAVEAERAEKLAARRADSMVRADRESNRRIEAARLEAKDADIAAKAAQERTGEIDRRISELSIALAHQRELLAAAQKDSRTAETRKRTAHLALTRAGGSLSD